MKTKIGNAQIINDVFTSYIFKNPVCRSLFLPVCTMMIFAKYLEVYGAEQNERLSGMIAKSTRDISIIIKFAMCNLVIVVLVELQALILCKAGQLGYRLANKDAFKNFLKLEPEKFNKLGKGEIQNTISRKSQAVQDIIDVLTLNFIPTCLTILFVSHSVFKSLGYQTVLLINLGIVSYALVTIRITEWRNEMRKKLNVAQNNAGNSMMDSLFNYEIIFTNNSENIEIEKYDRPLKSVEINSTMLAKSMYFLNFAQKGVWFLLTLLIVIQICYVNKELIKVEKFTFILSIIAIVMRSMDNLGFMYGKFKAALLNLKIGMEYDNVVKTEGFRSIFNAKQGLSIEDLTVKIGNKNIVKKANLTIQKGDKIAVIGENGCGKSTLLKSLVKLVKYDGEISIDDVSLKDFTEESLRYQIAYVPQNATLFDDSVMNNIKYGNTKLCDERIVKISKLLGIHESIMNLENGYEHKVGEQGKKLSGGERQKILILRAILRESPFLVMDEPTASLDKQAEHRIFKSILEMKDLTVISIVHNPDLLKMFERIVTLQNEQLIEVKDENSLFDNEIINFLKSDKGKETTTVKLDL